MAGDWLKFDSALPEKPETLAMTAALGWDDPDLTVGKLMRVFRWFDQQTTDGNAVGVTAALLDRVVGVTGFVTAMASVGWIIVGDHSLQLANFAKHNGASAKSRAQTAKRVANHRSVTPDHQERNAASVTEALAREEKRREDISVANATGVPPPPPQDHVSAADVIFALGVPLLTAAGVSDRNARSMLGLQRKQHGDAAVIDALKRCAQEGPIQPVPWLQAALSVRPPPNKRQSIEDENRRVADAFIARIK